MRFVHEEIVEKVAADLRARDFRVHVDSRSEKMGAKIRDARLQKIPYMLVMGAREAESGTVSVRSRSEGDLGAMPLADFIAKLDAERAASERAKKETEEKIDKIRALLAAEKEKLAEEREKLRLQAIEVHKQKLYPEYYKKKAAEKAAEKSRQAVEDEPPSAPTPAKDTKPTVQKRKDGAVRYFESADDVADSSPDSLWVLPE